MIGDAIPLRFSRRIKRKASLLPVRVSPKRKIRKSAVKKRTSSVNSPLLKAKEKNEVTRKNKLEENPDLLSKILKRASCNVKHAASKTSQMHIPKIYGEKRNTRNFLNTYQNNLTNDKGFLKNVELFDDKKVSEKKNLKKVNEEKLPLRRSFRLSKSPPKEKGKNKKPSDSDLKPSEKRRPCLMKSTKQVINLSYKSVHSPNPEKYPHISKHLGRKKSAGLSTEPENQEISVHMSASKSPTATPVPGKATRISRHSGNRKSGRLSKEPNRSRIINSGISLNTSSFHSFLETTQPEKHSEKRKSSRLLESSPLRTLNKELPLTSPASLTRNSASTLNKSAKSYKSIELLSPESHKKKQSRSKVSNKDGSTISDEKQKRKRQANQNRKTSKNFKKPLSNETENLPLDVLATPAFKTPCRKSTCKKYLSKSDSKFSKRKLNASTSENQDASEELKDTRKRKKSAGASKGTLKRKRWLLDHLKEKEGTYEDDIFENQNFDIYKQAFHFGDESDGSSVNIATPKLNCILTPSLPKKTPHYKDCISPMEFLQARKTAEEYLYRRNKKRKSGDRASSSGKKKSLNKKITSQDIAEKKKLDCEEAVNKLMEVKKNLEIEAKVDDEEEDSYFSDVSN